ncbi:MAG: hypothetical protein AB7P22_08905 [Vicinamibacterales bacterium]
MPGWDVQLERNGEFSFGRRFVLREHAEAEASDLRRHYEKNDWRSRT